MRKRRCVARLAVTAMATTALTLAPMPATGQTPSAPAFVPVTDAILQNPADGDWLTWRRTLDSWGYSPLDQVTRENVNDLQMVWTRALAPGRQEGTPLAYGGVLYMPQASDVIQAIDVVTGDLIWEYRRDRPDDLADYMIG
ncbi:MAG TPA: ATP-binding protein, partial [Acidobacteria bacterium]|nr:ATP-binding protein [Acidobacteriota bacterium]